MTAQVRSTPVTSPLGLDVAGLDVNAVDLGASRKLGQVSSQSGHPARHLLGYHLNVGDLERPRRLTR